MPMRKFKIGLTYFVFCGPIVCLLEVLSLSIKGESRKPFTLARLGILGCRA